MLISSIRYNCCKPLPKCYCCPPRDPPPDCVDTGCNSTYSGQGRCVDVIKEYVQASQYIYHLFGKSGSCTMMLAHYIESKHHSTSTTFSQSYHLRKGGSCTMILELFDVQASQYNYHLFRTAKIQCYQNRWQMYYDACSLYREQASQYNYHLFPFQANI